MFKNIKKSLLFWRSLSGATVVIFLTALWRMTLVTSDSIALLHSNWTFLWAIPFALLLFLFASTWMRSGEKGFNWLENIHFRSWLVSVVCGLVFILTLPVFSLIITYPHWANLLNQSIVSLTAFLPGLAFTSIRVFLFCGFVLFGMVCVRLAWKRISWSTAFLISFLAHAVTYCLVIDFSGVNNYPLTLGWSEASRYYGASLFFAQRLYGQKFPLPALHPTWHLLLTAPYFFGDLPIWVHRLWQAVLQTVLTLMTGIALSHRLIPGKKVLFWGITGASFLFLRQIDVLFSLLICVMLILAWADPRNFRQSSVVVILASIWAGLSRINWFPVPGMLMAVLYLLEIPCSDSQSWKHYLWKPIVWFLGGTGIAFSANYLYNQWSGNLITGGQFASSLSSDLLWDRLFPNAIFPLGILLTAVLASMPLILIIILSNRQHGGVIHPLRVAGIYSALAILLIGGLIVSVKIGGGSNLHNLDAYFLLLLLLGGYSYFRIWTPESGMRLPAWNCIPALFLVIAVPTWFILQTGGPFFTWNGSAVAATVNAVRSRVEQVSQQGSQVLFISERQLLALKTVNAPLIPAYEQDYLMEMVMSHNQEYLDQFQTDLRQHRFAMIVVGSQRDLIYEHEHPFAEENNLWVEGVSRPLLCYYEMAYPQEVNLDLDVAIYVPRETSCK
jgi:hypothetical protein